MAGKGNPKTGGRQKGTPNRATAEIRELARQYSGRAIDVLVSIMEAPDKNDNARIAAARELLDRGHGKPRQAIEADVGLQSGNPLEELLKEIAKKRSPFEGISGFDDE